MAIYTTIDATVHAVTTTNEYTPATDIIALALFHCHINLNETVVQSLNTISIKAKDKRLYLSGRESILATVRARELVVAKMLETSDM